MRHRFPLLLPALAVLLCSNATGQKIIAKIALGSGLNPTTIAVNPVTNKAYAVSSANATVSVIDGVTNSHLTDIPLGTDFPVAIGVNYKTNRIYVANEGGLETRVSVIDGSTDILLENISGFVNPIGVAVNPTTNRIYVTNSDGSVGVMDGATDAIVTTIPSAFSPTVGGIGSAVDSQTNMVYVGGQFAQYEVIDGSTNTVLSTVNLPSSVVLAGMAVDPHLNRLYVVDQNTYKLYVIDAATGQVITTVVGGFSSPHYACVNLKSDLVALSNDGGDEIDFINGNTDQITSAVRTRFSTADVDVNPLTGHYFTTYEAIGMVVVIGP
jgi:YVTN family beta-propeller protein